MWTRTVRESSTTSLYLRLTLSRDAEKFQFFLQFCSSTLFWGFLFLWYLPPFLRIISFLLVHRPCKVNVQVIWFVQHRLDLLGFLHPLRLRILSNLRTRSMSFNAVISNVTGKKLLFSTGATNVQRLQLYNAISWMIDIHSVILWRYLLRDLSMFCADHWS